MVVCLACMVCFPCGTEGEDKNHVYYSMTLALLCSRILSCNSLLEVSHYAAIVHSQEVVVLQYPVQSQSEKTALLPFALLTDILLQLWHELFVRVDSLKPLPECTEAG